MYFSIRHTTRFRYSSAISQSVMEVRMKPITEGVQHCLSFKLMTSPRARVLSYQDHLGNAVHHFDIPSSHSQLSTAAESVVHIGAASPIPEGPAGGDWDGLATPARRLYSGNLLAPPQFAGPAHGLADAAAELGGRRQYDPLNLLRRSTACIAESFEYWARTARADSPIDQAVCERKGV